MCSHPGEYYATIKKTGLELCQRDFWNNVLGEKQDAEKCAYDFISVKQEKIAYMNICVCVIITAWNKYGRLHTRMSI